MQIRLARKEELLEICRITDQAKNRLKDMGLDQWQKGYPSAELWTEDIRIRRCFVVDEKTEILGAFVFQTEPDPSYRTIDGHWLTDEKYASMHRVCVSEESHGKGVAGTMFLFGGRMACQQGYHSLRIDTHPGNLPMQHALLKSGFVKCGSIILAEGDEKGHLRWGYEKRL